MKSIAFISFFFGILSCHPEEEIKSNTYTSYTLSKVCELPNETHESSGIIFFRGLLWTINDSGNSPVIYAIDTSSGKLVHEVELNGANNYDWESLTQDEEYIYIADNGNNASVRSEFTIYQIQKKLISALQKQTILPAAVLTYKMDELCLEAIDLTATEYDSEAILVAGDSFYVYTKEWTSGYCHAFSISKNKPYGLATLKGAVELGFAVTGVTFTREGYIAFLGYANYHSYLHIVKASPNLLTIEEEIASFELTQLQGYQTEGITCVDGTIFVSCENQGIKQALFRLDFD